VGFAHSPTRLARATASRAKRSVRHAVPPGSGATRAKPASTSAACSQGPLPLNACATWRSYRSVKPPVAAIRAVRSPSIPSSAASACCPAGHSCGGTGKSRALGNRIPMSRTTPPSPSESSPEFEMPAMPRGSPAAGGHANAAPPAANARPGPPLFNRHHVRTRTRVRPTAIIRESRRAPAATWQY
jgi:hypothetical protein